MPLKTLLRYLFCFLSLSFSCFFYPDEKTISINSQTSPCGGFRTLGKQSSGHLLPEDTVSCFDETLFWRYDCASKVLTLTHRRVHDNCSAILSMYVVGDNNKLTVRQSDGKNPNLFAECDCTFDLYCEVPNISGQTITLAIDSFSFTLQLADQKGKCIIRPLEYLNLHGSTSPDLSFLSALSGLKSLQDVNVAAYTDLAPIGRLTNLTQFSGYNVDSIGFLAPCTKLENVRIDATQNLSDISAFRVLNNLTSITISGASSLQNLSPIGYCTKLTNLLLTKCVNIQDISSLNKCTFLSTLLLSKSPQISDISSLSGLTELSELTLDSIIGISSLAPLRSKTKLTSLYISDNSSISDISFLSTLTTLKSLVLINMTGVSDFTPLVSCLDTGESFIYDGTPVPENILDQLRQKGVAYKGWMGGR
jgi:hypothetical protein